MTQNRHYIDERTFDKGFSHSNINAMRTFYLQNPILLAVPAKLSWTMLVELQNGKTIY